MDNHTSGIRRFSLAQLKLRLNELENQIKSENRNGDTENLFELLKKYSNVKLNLERFGKEQFESNKYRRHTSAHWTDHDE